MHDAVAQGKLLLARLLTTKSLVILAILALAAPTFEKLANQNWSGESGAQGPIILMSGLWLLWRGAAEFRRDGTPGGGWLTTIMLAMAFALYLAGSMADLLTLEVTGLWGVCTTVLYSEFGGRLVTRNWFPLGYLAFVIPPPGWLVVALTGPLKQFATAVTVWLLQGAGLPIARAGNTIYIAQYQLLVADACAGMNSIFGLVAVSLFYIYLRHNRSKAYALFLSALTIPIAVIANILRIIILVLMTYGAGDAVAQGVLHGATGLFMFVSALLIIFGIDAVMSAAIARRRRKP
jgi:exosortase